MDVSDWKPIDYQELAAYERAQGTAILTVRNHYWYRTRPCFYQALAPVLPRDSSVVPPRPAILGGFKYCVPPGAASNASMAFLVSEKNYSSGELGRAQRRCLRVAAKAFEVRPLETADEFARDAHSVYLEFYRRTRYSVFRARQRREVFERWARHLYAIPPLLILGAYRGSQLHAVSISYWMAGILSYASVFSSDEAHHCHVADLMLHHTREIAARVPGIRSVLIRNFRGNSHDRFYLLRGAKVVVQPARVYLNPLVNLFLKYGSPRHHRAIWGVTTGNGDDGDLISGVSDPRPLNLPLPNPPFHGPD